jgi:hypothetical protein
LRGLWSTRRHVTVGGEAEPWILRRGDHHEPTPRPEGCTDQERKDALEGNEGCGFPGGCRSGQERGRQREIKVVLPGSSTSFPHSGQLPGLRQRPQAEGYRGVAEWQPNPLGKGGSGCKAIGNPLPVYI